MTKINTGGPMTPQDAALLVIETKPAPAAPKALILEIATRHFFVETLETRNSDQLDFHDVAVCAMRAALEDAFEAGRIAGANAMLAALQETPQ